MKLLPLPVEVALLLIVLTAAVSDIRSRSIPNWLTLGGIVAGLALNTYATGLEGLKFSAIGFGVAALIFLPLFMIRFLGGGDVKLMAAVGACAGFPRRRECPARRTGGNPENSCPSCPGRAKSFRFTSHWH
jgi:Flp pilus assembly protein protease CpaA